MFSVRKTLPATGEHDYTRKIEITTEPGCTTEGVKTLTCVCGDSITKPVPATGHIYDDEYDVDCNVCVAERSDAAPSVVAGTDGMITLTGDTRVVAKVGYIYLGTEKVEDAANLSWDALMELSGYNYETTTNLNALPTLEDAGCYVVFIKLNNGQPSQYVDVMVQ